MTSTSSLFTASSGVAWLAGVARRLFVRVQEAGVREPTNKRRTTVEPHMNTSNSWLMSSMQVIR